MERRLHLLVFATILIEICQTADLPLPAVYCGVQNDVILETDPIHHRYIPFLTKLPRCGGVYAMNPPNLRRCVKNTARNVSYLVRNVHDFKMNLIEMEHHLTCKPECVFGPSSCDLNYQTWDKNNCKCNCNYKTPPAVSPCPAGKIWKHSTCSCICNKVSKECSDKKEWNDEVCDCTCKKRYMNRCSRKNKVVNQESCACMEAPIQYINNTAAARGSNATCDGTSNKIVAMIVVLEFLFLVGVFFFIYRCCLRYDPELDPNISSLKRMKYEMNKTIRRLPGKNKNKPTTPPTQANGNVERPVTHPSDERNFSNLSFNREESKELTSSDRDEPVGFYPDNPDPSYYWESATNDSLESRTNKVSAV